MCIVGESNLADLIEFETAPKLGLKQLELPILQLENVQLSMEIVQMH